MASLLKKIYNKGKELVPEKVKKFVAPVVKPIIETIKPAVIKADKIIDQGVQTIKNIKNNSKTQEKPNAKDTTVNYKKGNYISESTKQKVNKIANEEIDAANELGEAFLKDPLGSVNKLVEILKI